MADKPSYLGLLNAIALGEGSAHVYLRAWADKTSDPDVREVIQTVAIREGEHLAELRRQVADFSETLSAVPADVKKLRK